MKKEMLINVLQPEEIRIAIIEDGVLEELYVERTSLESFVGNVYKGRIVNIEPSIQAAFVDFGVGRNGFLHVSDVEPTYYRHLEGGRDRDRGRNGERGRRDRGPRPQEPSLPRYATEEVEDFVTEAPPATEEDIAGASVGFDEHTEMLDEALERNGEDQAPRVEDEPLPEERDAGPRGKSGRRRGRGRKGRGQKRAEPRRAAQAEEQPQPEAPFLPSEEAPGPEPMPGAEHRTDEGSGASSSGKAAWSDEELSFSMAPSPSRSEPMPSEPDEVEQDYSEESDAVPDRDWPETDQTPSIQDRDETADVWDEPEQAPLRPDEEDLPAAAWTEPAPPEGSEPIDSVMEEEFPEAEIRELAGETHDHPLGRPREEFDDRPPRRAPRADWDDMGEPRYRDRPRRSRDDFRRGGDDRRGRDDRRGPRRMGPGRPGAGRPKPLIQDIFKRGQEVLVQVIKEGIGTKGPTLSTYISIAGRYLVLMPGLQRIGVSRKIQDDESRRRLREIMNELQPPRGLGFIIRTAGIDKNKKELQSDLAYLSKIWHVVVRRIKKTKSPAEIYLESDMVTRTIRDIFTAEIDTIWVDEPEAFEKAKEFLQVVMPRYAGRIQLYDQAEPMFHKYGIEDEIARIQERKVPLPSGGSIVIDQAEACVAIDVNSGNFRADNNAEETAYQMNLQAAKEIARQLRLRDLGGVIVNDFIDMRDEKHRRTVEKALRDAVKRDRARTKILRMSQFGIIEMTRQRIRPSLKRSVYHDCGHCRGTGHVKTSESMSIDVMRLLQLAAGRDNIARIEVRIHPEVAHFLVNRKRAPIAALEERGGKQIIVLGVPGTPPEHLEFVCLDNNGSEVKFMAHDEPNGRAPRRR